MYSLKTGQKRAIVTQTACEKCILQLFKYDLRNEICSALLRRRLRLKDSLFTVPPENDLRQTSEAE